MNKLLLGITAAFALSVVAPSISLANEEGAKDEKPAKAEKKGKKGAKKEEAKKEEAK